MGQKVSPHGLRVGVIKDWDSKWYADKTKFADYLIEDNKVRNVAFTGGCNGNLQGISHLVEGMDVNEAISRLEGIRCGFKSTSCPDQLAHALKEAIAK